MRPYKDLSIQQLEAFFAKNNDALVVLRRILKELELRKTKKAVELRSRVVKRIAELSTEAPPRRETPDVAKTPRRTARVPRTAREYEQAVLPLEGSARPRSERGREEAKKPPPAARHPRPDHAARIRGPEAAKGTPSKWLPAPLRTIEPTWQASDPLPVRYEKALRLLVEDMKRRKSGTQAVALEDGQQLRIDGANFAYRFHWQGDEELFEGASVDIVVGQQTVPGRILSVNRTELTVGTERDLGPFIRACVLRIDNTAMLVALADRMGALAGVGTQEVRSLRATGPFNAAIAHDVLSNAAPEETPAIPTPSALTADLNDKQRAAVVAALAHRISFLWGPPGTGKTITLSAMIRALFAAELRSLVCSNTNQAVDQVLAQLCKVLCGDKPQVPEDVEALREGWIVRVGVIATDGPLAPWNDYVSLDGVTARKTQELKTRLARFEEAASAIECRLLTDRETLQAHQELDRASAAEAAAVVAARQATDDAAARTRAHDEAVGRLAALQLELKAVEEAGTIRRAFMRSRQKIDADIQAIRAALPAVQEAVDRAARAAASAAAGRREATGARELAVTATAGKDREAARKMVESGEAQLDPIRTSISDLRRQIEDIAKTVLAHARVVGATATKLFLSPQKFGSFSTVIIDEASMLIPPALYNAAGLATERVIVSGDFRQLSPIVPSYEACLLEELGGDVFSLVGIQRDFDAGKINLPRTTMLEQQYRMVDPICRLLSGPMYRGKLVTAASRKPANLNAPEPFSAPLTIVDTSTLGPVANKDGRGSWFNVMGAIAVRNICRHLAERGFVVGKDSVGVVTPYAGQRKLIQRMLADAKLTDITAGTVHRFQGDEKQLIVLDLVDGIGRGLPGLWFQSDQPSDAGAKLLNVAISRARDHLVVVGDLAWLDRKLPASSFLRQWLHRMQDLGAVLDGRVVMAMWPVAEDLRRYGSALPADFSAARNGVFNERDFFAVAQLDIARAEKGIAIWSAFVTPQGVARVSDLLRGRIHAGVKVRCVLPAPDRNGSMGEDAWREAVRALNGIGATIDIRARMHEKVVLIDDAITWLGSLNFLSHAGNTREVMMRVEGHQTALAVAAFFAADPGATPERAAGIAYDQENPDCKGCGGYTHFVSMKDGGRFWSCRPCKWTLDARTGREVRRENATD